MSTSSRKIPLPLRLALRATGVGLAHCGDEESRLKARLANGFALIFQLVVGLFLLIDLSRGAWAEVLIDVAAVPVALVPMLLNARGHLYTARVALVLILDACALTQCYVLGSGAGVPFLFVCVSSMACALFGLKEWRTLTAALGVTAACLGWAFDFPARGLLGEAGPPVVLLEALHLGFCAVTLGALVLYMNATSTAFIAELSASHSEKQADLVRLAQVGKFAALGQLAAGLAHEVNNPLTVITGRAGALRRAAAQGELEPAAVEKTAVSIYETAVRIARITRAMLAFARGTAGGKPGDAEPVEVLPLLQTIEDLGRETLRLSGIALRIEAEPGLAFSGDFGQAQQVLLNLVANARDAILSGSDPLHAHWIRIVARAGDGGVVIEVSDSGPGIPAGVSQRVMEPFFTTKDVGQGTGLGLSLAKGLVEGMAGTLELARAAAPTTFRITLAQAEAAPVSSSSERASA